jgi:arylsulfatase A-like enzyme/predicted Zn-dependent protease
VVNVKKYYIFSAIFIVVTIFFVKFFLQVEKNPFNAKDYNLLIITLDTMRADHLGSYGYEKAQTPNLNFLAEEGVLFENCYTPVPLTLPAHCSAFTGRYPISHGVRDNGRFFLGTKEYTLAEAMKELGYHTYGLIACFVLHSKFGLSQGFDQYDDSLELDNIINSYDSEIEAHQVYTKFYKWFKKKGNDNFFSWIHFYDPHVPYDPPEEFQEKFGDGLIDRYDGEVAYTDFYIGKIIDDLKRAGELDQTMVIIIGDHGEAFGEHHEYGHSIFCYEENLHVPLIFYCPQLFSKGLRVKDSVNLIDLMPTLLDIFGQSIPGNIQGKSLVDLLMGAKEKLKRNLYFESKHGQEEMGWAPVIGIVNEKYKYISLPEPELYDLERDKKESKNLFLSRRSIAKKMDKKLKELMLSLIKSGGVEPTGSRRSLNRGDISRLQSLGYISSFSDKCKRSIDPKKGILIKNQYDRIEELLDAGEWELAESNLHAIAKEHPDIIVPRYFGFLNKIYKKRADQNEVIINWQNALRIFPKNEDIRINLALELYAMNRLKEGEKMAQEIIMNNKAFTRAYILMGQIQEKRGDIVEALTNFEKAIQLEPKNVLLKITYAKLLGRNKKFRDSEKICQQLLEDEYILSNPELKIKIGIILTEIHKNDLSFRILNEAVKSGDATAEAWNYLGIIYYRQSDYKHSSESYLKSIKLNPGLSKTYNNLGVCYLTWYQKAKKPDYLNRAIYAFNQALKIDPELASALNGRASAKKIGNHVKDALKDWQKAIMIKPDFIDVYFNISITYLQMGNKSEALKYLYLCKTRFYNLLSHGEQDRLNNLIYKIRPGG